MAKVYDALRKAEEERKRAASGESVSVAAVEWDTTPASAPKRRGKGKVGIFKRLLRRTVVSPDSSAESNKRRFALLQPDSTVAEQFRMLRGRIDAIAAQRPLRTIAIASANPGDGKSTAAINLALVTAMSVGRRVLLVDCDLRRPSIQRSLGLMPKSGLAEILLGKGTIDDAVMRVEDLPLDAICVCNQPPNPSELLSSMQMRDLVEELAGRYDRIILDTPASLGLPDAKAVIDLCDGVVMVVRAGTTPSTDVEAALEVLDRRRVLGLLLNGAASGREHYGYY